MPAHSAWAAHTARRAGLDPATADIRATCARAADWCKQKGVDIAQLAMQFALSNPDVQTTLSGTANPDNLKKKSRG